MSGAFRERFGAVFGSVVACLVLCAVGGFRAVDIYSCTNTMSTYIHRKLICLDLGPAGER